MKGFTIKFKVEFKRRAGVKPSKTHKNKKGYTRKKKHKHDARWD